MSNIWTLFRATAVVAGSSAALLMGGLMGTAHADPAAAPIPAPDIGQQLITSAAGAPQVLQNLGAALSGQPATPPPLASIRVPQPSTAGLPGAASAVPGASSLVPGLPGAAPAATTATPGLGIPGLTPTAPAAAPAAGPAGLLPQAQLNLPQIPFLGIPLPQQISLPGDLTSLVTGGVPASPGVGTPGVASLPVAAPTNPLLFPVSGLP
ncbi:hypothetical protein [Candidatus Mycobacterium methanotrophicum]|uniref:Uncharacterized protein n=1 Tax=Candidatus Mycobacterium methanotrophicum TaxID=2943498 RepID=A0ABY4QHD3_9MYCO|nr:hypothetical protein [Candidatus Mycobacterium methanotrophicum]UQX10393.1 hypothetical protein M5I08_20115 [Candidatus Mycobacterium methanotrophicum]